MRTNTKGTGSEIINMDQVIINNDGNNFYHFIGLCQVHMSNLSTVQSPTSPKTKENRLSKAMRRLSLKRSPTTSQSFSEPVSPLKLLEYIPYYQVWENGKKVTEKELRPDDDAPNLDAPVEVALECGYNNSKSLAN